MRKESATIRKCHSRLSSLGLDSTVAFHKSKLILKIYRDVVWVLSERAQELQEYAWELGDQDLSTGLCYLENFAPNIDLQDFEEKVCCVIQSQMLVDVINRALLRLKRYPDRGELYYEILSKQFIYRFNSTEKELLDELNMERSVFYDRKKEAIYLFSICLFGYVINEHPEIMVTWFQPDEKKDGGQYITTTGRLKRFDESACMLLLKDGSNIPISHIIRLESAYFEGLF